MDDSSLEIISLMVNPIVRRSVKGIAKKWALSSPLSAKLRDFYVGLVPGNHKPTDAEVELYLKSIGFTESEVGLAVALKTKYETVPDDGASTLIDAFFAKYKRDRVLELQNIYNKERDNDENEALTNFIRELGKLDSVGGTKLEVVNFSKIDLKEFIKNEMLAKKYLVNSRFKLVREFTNSGAYEKGWIVQVAAPTSVGKTQWLLNEVEYMAQQKEHICWFALGDMESRSILKRLMCLSTRTNRNEIMNEEVAVSLADSPDLLEVLPYIDFVFKPAQEMTASDIVNYVDMLEQDKGISYGVIVIDYDDNLKSDSGNMYEQGGAAFAELTRLAKRGMGTENPDYKLVFVASQIKPEFWDKEDIPKQGVATSSAKQMRVDMLITIGKNADNPSAAVGTMSIVKHRAGDEGSTKYRREDYGRFRGIDYDEYVAYLNSPSRNREHQASDNISGKTNAEITNISSISQADEIFEFSDVDFTLHLN